MAGVTDWAFRTICARMGAGMTVTEMVSSRALVYRDRKSAGLLRKNEGSLVGAQIFGNDPQVMAQGAALALELSGCDWIDINMGCPMTKVVSNGDGSALMKDIPLAARIVEAVAQAVPVPVTVKCRLGWDRGSINVVALAQAVEERLKIVTKPITVAVMGCPVNGPGEAAAADVGIAGGNGKGILFRHGEVVRQVPQEELLDALMALIEEL